MANLAIKGHPTRGKEIIEILEMLGGINKYNITYTEDNLCYCLRTNDNMIIATYPNSSIKTVLSIEEFLEKFPYKIGDRVRVYDYESEVPISRMYWDGYEVQYEVVADEAEWYSARELNEFNEPNKPNKEKKINQMSLANCDLDEVEIVLGDKFELKIREGKYYAIRKKFQYPKTYEECHELMVQWKEYDCNPNSELILCDAPIHDFCKLIVARNIYWKIAGEQMGLGKPWEPDWSDYENIKYIIGGYDGEIGYDQNHHIHKILAFPTEEMRDAFYENFGHLIELCKELL